MWLIILIAIAVWFLFFNIWSRDNAIRQDYAIDIDQISSVINDDMDKEFAEMRRNIRTDRETFERRLEVIETHAFSGIINDARRVLRESGYDPLYLEYKSSNGTRVSFSYNETPECGGCIQFLDVNVPTNTIIVNP